MMILLLGNLHMLEDEQLNREQYTGNGVE